MAESADAVGLTLARAVALLSLPRELGAHPETSKPVTAGIGRFGPWVHHDGSYASLRASKAVREAAADAAAADAASDEEAAARGEAAIAAAYDPTSVALLTPSSGKSPMQGGWERL